MVVAQVTQRNEDFIACSVLLPVMSFRIVFIIQPYDYITRNHLNPFKPNEISHCYQLDLSIFVLRVFGFPIVIEQSISKQFAYLPQKGR